MRGHFFAASIAILALAGCVSFPGQGMLTDAQMPKPAPLLTVPIPEQPGVQIVTNDPAPMPAPLPVPCVKYTQGQLDAFADALANLDAVKPKGYQVIEGFLSDYHDMRVNDDECDLK